MPLIHFLAKNRPIRSATRVNQNCLRSCKLFAIVFIRGLLQGVQLIITDRTVEISFALYDLLMFTTFRLNLFFTTWIFNFKK